MPPPICLDAMVLLAATIETVEAGESTPELAVLAT